MNCCKIIIWKIYRENHTLGFQYGRCQRHVCLMMKMGNQFGPLGKCAKSLMWSLGSVKVVRGLVDQLDKSDEVVTTVFAGLISK